MSANTNKPAKNYLPIGCLGALFIFGGLFVGLGVLSGEVKKSMAAQWILVFLFLVLGSAGLFAAWKVRKKEKAAKPGGRFKPPTPSPASGQPPISSGEVRCPSCGHIFVPLRIMMVTEAVARRFGPNPIQCPKCKHIWGRT